jgi:hypothetical protein
LTIIAEIAKDKLKVPSPALYKIKPITPWGGSDSRNNSDSLFSKDKRDIISQEIENLNQKKERSTPSPLYYTPNYKLVETSPGPGASAMKM